MIDRIHDIWLEFNPVVHLNAKFLLFGNSVEAELIGGKNLNMIIQQCIWEIIANYVEKTRRFNTKHADYFIGLSTRDLSLSLR